jgi:hypothetical protein
VSAPELVTGVSAVTTAEGAPVDSSSTLPDHLVRLSGDWAFWRWVAIRGAGFPVSQSSVLAAPQAAAAADVRLEREEHVRRLCHEALDAIRAERDGLEDSERNRAHDVVKRLHKIDPTRPLVPRAIEERFPALAAACAAVHAAHDDYRAEFARGVEAVVGGLCTLAQDDRFREAMLWQNRGAVHRALDPMRVRGSNSDRRNSDQRRNEQLIAAYLLRYTTKNDTIGFFGPVGWATLSEAHDGLIVRPGPQLLAERDVYFESWGIDALAAALASDPRLEPWLLPRRAHTIDVGSGALLSATAPPVALSRGDEALLRACDGDATVREIATRITTDPSLELTTEADVLARLREFRDKEWIALTIAVPMEVHADRTLARLLRRIDDEEVRAFALGALEEMQDARARVAAAAGRPVDLDAALGALEQTFTRLTGTAPTRAGGQTYAGRTLVYEDCRRDLEVVIGRDVLDALRSPLELLLTSSRWLTFEMAARYMSTFTGIYRQLAQAAGTGTIPFAGFLNRALEFVLRDRKSGPSYDVEAEFQQRWERILDPPADQSRVEYSSDQLRPLVDAAFDAPGPGWPFGRYHSPDVLIAAQSAEHVARGDYLLVLGELHTGSNTLGSPVFLEQHPDRDALRRAVAIDLPEPRLEPIVPKFFWPGQSARTMPTLVSPDDYRLELCPDPSGTDPSRVLPVSRFCIAQVDDRLVVRTRDGLLEFDLQTVMAQLMTWLVVARFNLLTPRVHQPRLTIDRMVVAREAWSFTPKEMTFAFERDEADQFLGARRWARKHDLPCDVFVRVPKEKKPFQVDFTSPVCVNILSKAVRLSADDESPASRVTLSEMLPAKHESWLIDRDGHRYTTELRFVAVDQRSRVR